MTPNEGICVFEMGRAQRSLGDAAAARDSFVAAIAIFEGIDAKGDLRDAFDGLADAEEALGNAGAALAALRRVRALQVATDDEAARRGIVQRELRDELARLSQQWQKVAATDALTGLGNRRGLDAWLGTAMARAAAGEALRVLLFDMDHFKSINDRFGHAVGDEVLRTAARLIRENCRPGDLAARYGGEEFVLALTGLAADVALECAERLRASIESHDWTRIAAGLTVTISIGLAHGGEASDAAALLQLADRRLYAAKHGGRNRVVASG